MNDIKRKSHSDYPASNGEWVINNGGVTIGKTLTNVLNIDTTQTTGTIEYKDVMTEFVNTSKSYFETTTATLSKVNDEFLLGGLQILTKDRKYTQFAYDYNIMLLNKMTSQPDIDYDGLLKAMNANPDWDLGRMAPKREIWERDFA